MSPRDDAFARYLSELNAVVDRLRAVYLEVNWTGMLRNVMITACLMIACHTIGLILDELIRPRSRACDRRRRPRAPASLPCAVARASR